MHRTSDIRARVLGHRHLRGIAARLVTKGAKKGQHPSPATVMRMLREHDEQAAAAEPELAR